jgi:prepilin-type N-terminal cleavage/methylation domain-containing protein
MKQTKKAFTLVELIIVITILAILATIGFMSYQSYTADARNGKRSSDISSLQSKLEILVAKNGTSIVNFASGSANTLSGSTKTLV